MMTLNRLDITGPLDDSTPIVVIEEILNSHGFDFKRERLQERKYLNNIIDKLVSARKITVQDPIIPEEFPIIVNYINSDFHSWSEKKMTEAFSFLNSFIDSSEVPLSPKAGPQTPTSLYSLNACVLYKLCKTRNIVMRRSTSIQTMERSLQLLLMPESFLVTELKSKIPRLNIHTLVNIFNLTELPFDPTPYYPSDPISIEELLKAHADLGHAKLDRIFPESNNEAVVLGALINHIDLSLAPLPCLEYMNIKTGVGISESFNELYSVNPMMFELNLTFNPMFPESLYLDSQLERLAKMEGIDGVNYYEGLQIAYCSNSWYPGHWNKSDLITRIDLDFISSLKTEELVCYGIRDNNLIPYKWTELINLFKSTKQLNGADNIPFEAVKKLKNLCIFFKQEELYNTICEIEFEKSKINETVKLLKKAYLISKDPERDLIFKVLLSIFHLGMFMRGWDGKGNYPIEESTVPDQNLVENLVSDGFRELYLNLEILGKSNNEIKELIMKLPLGRDNHGEFQVNDNPDYGLTLFQRLEIVKKGETVSTINTCIRLSSNWIVPSAYYYLKAINKTPLFNSELLIDIS